MSFRELHLSETILRTLEKVGYHTPTEVQSKVIPHVLIGRDVVALAQTGTGKTAAYALPLIDILAHGRSKSRMPRSLILVPTRELAHQVSQDFATYAADSKLDVVVLVGGESIVDQQKLLTRSVDVVIATPGRLMDIIARGQLLLSDTKILVLDEADRMLDMGFLPDIEAILSALPPNRQTLLLSATMPSAIEGLVRRFLNAPKEIKLVNNTVALTLEQQFVGVEKTDKLSTVQNIISEAPKSKGFVFCNRKRDASQIALQLSKQNITCFALHGDLPQSERTRAIEAFRASRGGSVMVATDIAARGLDIDDIDYVVNFDIPLHAEDYVHRIGRSGRAGRKGTSHSLVMASDYKLLLAIYNLTKEPTIHEFISSQNEAKPSHTKKTTENSKTKLSSPASTSKDKSTEKRKAHEIGKSQEGASVGRVFNAEACANEIDHPSSRRGVKDGPKVTVTGFGEEVPAFFKHAIPMSIDKID